MERVLMNIFCVVFLSVTLSSCSSCSSDEDGPPPNEVFSGFKFQNDAFSFPNFAEDESRTAVHINPTLYRKKLYRYNVAPLLLNNPLNKG